MGFILIVLDYFRVIEGWFGCRWLGQNLIAGE